MVQQFTTISTFTNPYVACILNNMDLVNILTNKREDWMRKYHKII